MELPNPNAYERATPSLASSGLEKMFEPNMFDTQHQLFDMMANYKLPETNLGKMKAEEEFESTRSATDNLEGGVSGEDEQDQDQDQPRPAKKKRFHRHTLHQIQEMEAFFKECPHPDDKQRKELSRRLGLEPLQVKFWFQNKRTQMKSHHERSDNQQLRAVNEKLRADNMRYKEALSSASCPNCGGLAAIGEMSFDEQHLRIENARLREEIDRISSIAAKYVGKPLVSYTHVVPGMGMGMGMGPSFGTQPGMIGGDIYGGGNAGDLLRSVSGPTEADKPMIIELAVAAMEELMKLAEAGEPLWTPTPDAHSELLSQEDYFKMFPRGIGPTPLGFKSEASRDQALVFLTHINLVEIFMDVNQWSSVFCGIVSRAMTLEVLSTGVAGNHNGALQVMTAEFQVGSPLVPTRENYFVRYCKQHGEGSWAVVDVSLDSLRASPVAGCRRRPSGCLIQQLPDGYCKVIWVEHVEVDDRAVHNMYRAFVSSSLGFGAKRWVATLERQCERLVSSMASDVPSGDGGVIRSAEGRKSILKVAERMVKSFCSGVGGSTAQTWTMLSGSGGDDVRVMSRKSMDEAGRPPGIVLSAATSLWIPLPPNTVFDFLRDHNSRTHWDILSSGGLVQEMLHIANGRNPGNCVSLLRVDSANSSQSNMLILQESCTDPSGSYVVYAPVDIPAMNLVLSGGDPDYVALLPSGFAILPDGPSGGTTGGSLLTVAFQILVDSVPTAKLSLGSVATVNNLIKCTVEKIKDAVASHGA
ncbi:hypothetical protein V2J09_006365 [Rumex salicifolius]